MFHFALYTQALTKSNNLVLVRHVERSMDRLRHMVLQRDPKTLSFYQQMKRQEAKLEKDSIVKLLNLCEH